jgi:glycosyltransferase involved in cell wall biosynthesis
MKKKILIFYSISPFPKIMASQDRVIKMLQRLAEDHIVDFAFIYRDQFQLKSTLANLKLTCRKVFPIKALNPIDSQLKRKYYAVISRIYEFIFLHSREFYYLSRSKYQKILIDIVNKNDYDIVQVEFWYAGQVFKYFPSSIFKVIDTHMIAFEEKQLYFKKKYGNNIPFRKKLFLKRIKKMETEMLDLADMNIAISSSDLQELSKNCPGKTSILIPMGQDIDSSKNFKVKPIENTILFYGSMGGKQNIFAFFRFWNNIYPIIIQKIPSTKLLVVGNNPPESIKSLANGKSIIVTGFVDDIREHLARAGVMVLPLEVGVGFRSRVIEAMSLGIPVVGTHNALDCLEMTHGVHGYISDSNQEIADYLITILLNSNIRNSMSAACKAFVVEKYDIESTYGKLAKYYLDSI